MKNLKRIAPLAAALVVSFSAAARAESRDDFKMPCSEVMRLGYSKFMDAFNKRTNDYSTAGHNFASDYYRKCKRESNDRAAKKLPAARRTQVAAVRGALSQLGDSCWTMLYLRAGGGTMWSMMAASGDATREDLMAACISQMARPSRSQPAARRKANSLFADARKRLASLQKAEIPDMGDGSTAAQKKNYAKEWNTAQKSLVRLSSLLRALPDAAAQTVAERINQDAHVSEEETV